MKKIKRIILRVSMTIIILFIGILTGCTVFGPKSDAILDNYVQEFAKDLGIDKEKLNGISLNFVTQEIGTIGSCYYNINRITIDPSYWFQRSKEIQRKALVYHELGHCYCEYGHDDSTLKDGCSKSIMHSIDDVTWCLEKHWDYYIKDLKEKCKEKI